MFMGKFLWLRALKGSWRFIAMTGMVWIEEMSEGLFMIQVRYKSLGSVGVYTKALGRVLGHFCLLGTILCMHRYD